MGTDLVLCCLAVGGCAFASALAAVAPPRAQGRRMLRARPPAGVAGAMQRLVTWSPLSRALASAGAARRRAECLRQMPVMLDVVTLGLSAGLSFDSSLELYCNRYDDALARELGSAMLSWRLGTASREEALGASARRLGIASLERFSAIVSQALAFGSPLAAALEQQAQVIREEQRAQIEEEVERVPVKMLIPLGTLIVPAMLLAILGPLLGASLSMG